MPENKYFNTVESESHFEIKIQHSIFISHLKSVDSFEEAKKYISKINTDYKDATHNCWAYIIGDSAQDFHSSDAGEPSGTAGKPILNTLQKYKMTNIVAVVTRYYGGTKLGVRGLIDAYSKSTEECIINSRLKVLIQIQKYKLKVPYDFFETVKYNLKNYNAQILDIEYSESISFLIQIEKDFSQDLTIYLTELQNTNKIYFEILQDSY